MIVHLPVSIRQKNKSLSVEFTYCNAQLVKSGSPNIMLLSLYFWNRSHCCVSYTMGPLGSATLRAVGRYTYIFFQRYTTGFFPFGYFVSYIYRIVHNRSRCRCIGCITYYIIPPAFSLSSFNYPVWHSASAPSGRLVMEFWVSYPEKRINYRCLRLQGFSSFS